MNRAILKGVLAAIAGVSALLAQQPAQPAPAPEPAPAQPASPVAKQPQPKSKGELEALQAMFQAKDPDSRIQAAEALITKYADTEFKDLALFFAAMSAEQKGDGERAIVYGERAVEANPKNYNALYLLARVTAARTREHDLDREEKIGRVEKYVKDAEAALQSALKPNPSLTDEQWEAAKKELMAGGREPLGMTALARKDYDKAVKEFKAAVEGSPQPEPATMVRLGAAYNLAGKYDDAIAILDKVLAMAGAHPQVKKFAQDEKTRAVQAKSSGAKPAAQTPSTTVTPGTVEIRQP